MLFCKMLFLAQLGNGGTSGGKGGIVSLLIPFGLMFAIMYFLMIRPQRKKEKDRKEMISRVRKNDRVITSSGIHGKVVSVKDNSLIITIDEAKDVKIKIDRNAIATVSLSESEEKEEE